MSMYKDSLSAQIAVTTVHSVLATLNIAGNSLVCAVIMKNQDMRTSINYLLINLAIADMAVAVFFAPQFIFIHAFTHPDGVTGTMLCRLLTGGNFAWVGGAASVFTMVTIAFERFYAVVYPFGHKGKLTKQKLKVILPCSWIFGVLTNVPGFLSENFDKELNDCTMIFPEEWMGKAYSLFWFLMFGIFPVLMMATLYSRVVYALWFNHKESDDHQYRQQGVIKIRKRVTLMAIAVSFIFSLCWLADSIAHILGYYAPNHTPGDILYETTSIMIMFNSAINPILYALVNQTFRTKIQKIMCCSCRPAKRIYAARESLKMKDVQSVNNPTQTIG